MGKRTASYPHTECTDVESVHFFLAFLLFTIEQVEKLYIMDVLSIFSHTEGVMSRA